MKIRIATRKSELALFQANLVAKKLIEKNNSILVELVPMSSDGDETDAPLHQIGGKGLFINTLESALLKEKADIAVHSLKDVPAKLDEDFCIAAVLKRASAGDKTYFSNLLFFMLVGINRLLYMISEFVIIFYKIIIAIISIFSIKIIDMI